MQHSTNLSQPTISSNETTQDPPTQPPTNTENVMQHSASISQATISSNETTQDPLTQPPTVRLNPPTDYSHHHQQGFLLYFKNGITHLIFYLLCNCLTHSA